MEKITFRVIPNQYVEMKKRISKRILENLYNQYNFLYFSYIDILKQDYISNYSNIKQNVESFLFNYFQNVKFLTYNYFIVDQNRNNAEYSQTVDAVICVEGNCIIIEQINFDIIQNVLEKLKLLNISILNVTDKNIDRKKTDEEQIAIEEIDNFISNGCFGKSINQNYFMKLTFSSIVGFSIRRFYYPTSYFKNPSFFIFKQEKKKIIIQKLMKKLNDTILSYFDNVNRNTENIETCKNISSKRILFDFHENDFIELRNLGGNNRNLIKLVIHCETLYVFAIKIISEQNSSNNNEIYFCLNYSDYQFIPCYGFIKRREKVIGIVYEFMPNGTLEDQQLDEPFILLTIFRIFKGIQYLQSNSLIHLDLKPDNILLDHDFLPYISDFETVRIVSTNGKLSITENIGSNIYSSPEQLNGQMISYPADIFSFGKIICFLYKKKNTIPNNINIICQNCIKNNPDERFKCKDIDSILNNEITSYEKYFCDIKSISKPQSFSIFFSEIYVSSDIEVQNILLSKIHIFIYQLKLDKSVTDSAKYAENLSKTLGKPFELSKFYVKLGYRALYKNPEKNYLLARICFERAADKNNPKAFFNLGVIYYEGYGVEKNYARAKEFFEKAEPFGDADALFCLGLLYKEGFGCEQNYFMAKRYFELASSQNQPWSFLYLGILYFYGLGVQQNILEAIKYFNLSGEYNVSDGFLCLGIIYYDGLGVKKDYKKAGMYFKRSADLSNSKAFCTLGIMYMDGLGFEKDYEFAEYYFKLALQYKHFEALNNLGKLYILKKDYSKGIEYFVSSMKQGNYIACFNLGVCYLNGIGFKQDYSMAARYIEFSAKQNYSEALFLMGSLFLKGKGVSQNYSFAKVYFEEAAKQNNSDALLYLGHLYQYGYGVEINYIKAKEYYELSFKQGNLDGLFQIGYLYQEGLGVKKDYEEARKYYQLVLQNDKHHVSSLINLGFIYFIGYYNIVSDHCKAEWYFQEASKYNDSNALYNLGVIYLKELKFKEALEYLEKSAKLYNGSANLLLGVFHYCGFEVPIDYNKAKRYLTISSQQKNSMAYLLLGEMYYEGKCVAKDYKTMLRYFEYSAQLNNTFALFILGELYSIGGIIKINIQKSIEYYEKCIKICEYNYPYDYYSSNSEYIKKIHYYSSYNNLGLIYLIDINGSFIKSFDYIKIAANGEYPFAQNNLGLILQFYFNNKADAEYRYYRASQKYFALSEYNLGYLKEIENNIKESINHYKLASDYENKYLLFMNFIFLDARLEISIVFILCFTNLKLTSHYLSLSDFNESRKFFIRSIQKIILIVIKQFPNYKFKNGNKKDSFLKKFILGFPLFNLKYRYKWEKNYDPDIFDYFSNVNTKINHIDDEFNLFFNDPSKFFDNLINNEEKRRKFIDDINEIIDIMKSILYTPPYSILFGRIIITPNIFVPTNNKKNINKDFYEGFNIT